MFVVVLTYFGYHIFFSDVTVNNVLLVFLGVFSFPLLEYIIEF